MHRIGPSAQCRSFTPEFKAEAVRLCQIGDRTISRVASDLNIGENALREWVQRAKIDAGNRGAGVLTSDEREEFMRLRREHKRVLMDLEVLTTASQSRRSAVCHVPCAMCTKSAKPTSQRPDRRCI